jgi:DNA-binding MarR family transcriptional regulator
MPSSALGGHPVGMMGLVPSRVQRAQHEPPSADELAERVFGLARMLGKSSTRSQLGPLSAARYEVMHAVYHDGPQSMSRVAGRLQVSPRTITDLVDGLEADGYLERSRHPTDRRKTVLTVTDQGRTALGAARRERLANAAGFFASLDPDERSTMGRLLDKITSTVPPHPDEQGHG